MQRTAGPDPAELLTISRAAELLGVSVVTLRRWDESGKFRARRHPINGYRLYRSRDVESLKRKMLGVPGR
ncbi:MAG: MerR family DNA-binding transcriptional regulator [Myxococcales bacterium]|nr:MerR family DNA-binding transcriptional regulator [Myxococcales bacterium]